MTMQQQRFYEAIKKTMAQTGLTEFSKAEEILIGTMASFFEEHIELCQRVAELEKQKR